jgi:hypothetical protein
MSGKALMVERRLIDQGGNRCIVHAEIIRATREEFGNYLF